LAERVKELRCLHAITVVSNKDDMQLPEILKGIALILPSALIRPVAATCEIQWRRRTFRSPNYVEPTVTISIPLEVGGTELGRVTLGYTGPAEEVSFMPEEEQLLKTAANLVGQMLSRREGRDRLEQQSQELWRRQAMFEQTERLAKVGGWEYDVKARTMTWSEEVRRIAFPPTENFAPTGEGLTSAFLHDAIEEALRTNQPFDLELPWTLPSGKRKWLHTVGQVQMVEGEPTRIFGIVKDITEEKEARARIWHMANHDALTGLPNRRYFQEKLEAAYADTDNVAALLMIDLDHFKEVNDTLGHDVGDALLRAVAERLTEAAGEATTVARLGGDEFAVLAPALDRAAACAFAETLLARLNRPIMLAGRMSSIRFSAGLAIAPADGPNGAELQKNADIALYFGKMRGRAAFVTYAPEMRAMVEHRIQVCSDVREALDANQLVPFYQPKVSLKTGEITGFEALLRWAHPDGIRGPAAVMPAFEDRELAIGMGKAMLERVLSDMNAWKRLGLNYGHVALNASAAEFTGFDLAGHVLERVASAGLPPHSLGIEVTETVLLGRDAEPVGPMLRRLSAAGIQIALDDFGTGYASLTHLQQYPVDVIKIDQTFIRGLTADSGSQAITSAVLGLGRNLGMTVIAEGVETSEHALLLRAAGCDQAQGYLFAQPMPAAEVPAFLRNWNPAKFGLASPVALSAA
jgi:diguanylate cyclase (GGDEF)-like protein